MMKHNYYTTLGLVLLFCVTGRSQTIRIDGDYSDWDNIAPIEIDVNNDGRPNGIDIGEIKVYDDTEFIYFFVDIQREIDLQEDNEFAVYVDFDNDINTGFRINGIGSEVRYFFGERDAFVSTNGLDFFADWDEIELIAAPGVSAEQFEFRFAKNISEPLTVSAESVIRFRFEDNSFNGDEAPNDLGGIEYTLQNNDFEKPAISLSRENTSQFRVMSYNIENDQLFDTERTQYFDRIFNATNPDIILFQEIRDFSATETRNRVSQFISGNWSAREEGFGTTIVTKYEIIASENIDANGAYLLDIEGQDVLFINCHLPCCDNDTDRQQEVDNVMRFIREIKEGNGEIDVESGTPIIIGGDMNFVGDNNQLNTFLTGDIFFNGSFGADFPPDWDDSNLESADATTTGVHANYTWYNPFGSFLPGKLDWIFYTGSRLILDNTFALFTPEMTEDALSLYQLESNDVLFAADHLPLIADFRLGITNTEDNVSVKVELYPNPTSDFIRIQSEETILDIEVVDQTGKRIASMHGSQSNTQDIDTNEWNSGLYYIRVHTKSGESIRKIARY